MSNGQRPSEPVDRQRLVDLMIFEYRSLVVRRLNVTAEWGLLDWTDRAACAARGAATEATCVRCEVAPQCLAAALAGDDHAEWRGRLSRLDREALWVGMERTYREVRDLELIRVDVGSLARPAQSPANPTSVNGLER